ncbi:MAG: HAMP domain-containing histidine kinase, partial [Gammaproteobacteria bacterium]|nr:HAMP domain-containing histidine kinase [Gammaproteobacteria bacterium]
AMDQGHGFGLHIWGMWFGFFLSAGLIAYFVVRMGDTLRARDRALVRAREDTLHAERLLALGTLAAGTAHEFGTPLAAMAVLAKELQRDHAAMPALAAKLRVLRDQIERCKHILATMSASAGQLQAASGGGVLLNRYLEQTLEEWRATRPGVQLQSRCEGPQPVARIVAEQTLTQALLNILNNAADASPHCVEVEALWSERELTIEVRDRGQGVTPEVESQAGQAFFSTKAPGRGLGLGLFLAHTTINRLGGSVRLFNRDDGGACTRVILPLSPLLAAA